MRKNILLIVVVPFLFQAVPALAVCHEKSAPLVPQALVGEVAQITHQVRHQPTADQIKLLQERVLDLKNASQAQLAKGQEVQKALHAPGDCGTGLTEAQCIQRKIAHDDAKMSIMADGASKKALQTEVADLKAKLQAPRALKQNSQYFSQASSDLSEMIKTKDFSYKEHLGIIGKALLSSWKELLKPGPIVAISAGMAGYGVARTTSLNDDANQLFIRHPAPSTAGKISDQFGYGYPEMLPFLIVAATTHNNHAMKTFDALAVGTAISQAIIEPLKYGVAEPRPNGAGNVGFPSGHATETFMMATVLDHEYPGHHHLVGIASYAGAATVSFFRVWERNHTPGQVMAGAGIGYATGLAASEAVDNEWNAAQGKKAAYWKEALTGNFMIPKTKKSIHCVPTGLGGACAMSW